MEIRHHKRFETCKRDGMAKKYIECIFHCHRHAGICKEQIPIEGKENLMICKVPIAEEIAKRNSN